MPSTPTSMPILAFTSQGNGRLNVLVTEVQICDDNPETHPGAACGKFNAIWDTGATCTVISPAVAEQCQLKPIGVGMTGTANGLRECNKYLITIRLPNNVQVVDLPVLDGGMDGIDVLIGMDLISLGDFAITNYQGQTTFTYRLPSAERIDFVADVHGNRNRKANTAIPLPTPPPSEFGSYSKNVPCHCGSGKKYKKCCMGTS